MNGSDWTNDPAWDAFVAQVREHTVKQIEGSAAVMQIAPGDEPDIKVAVELGLSILMDKPLIIVALPGRPINDRLARIADEIVYADIDTENGKRDLIAALDRMGIPAKR